MLPDGNPGPCTEQISLLAHRPVPCAPDGELKPLTPDSCRHHWAPSGRRDFVPHVTLQMLRMRRGMSWEEPPVMLSRRLHVARVPSFWGGVSLLSASGQAQETLQYLLAGTAKPSGAACQRGVFQATVSLDFGVGWCICKSQETPVTKARQVSKIYLFKRQREGPGTMA